MNSGTIRRVVVTGVGAVTPAGNTMDRTWEAVLAGRSGAAPINLFDGSLMPCGISYEVSGLAFDESVLADDERQYCTRATTFAVTATGEALAEASLLPGQGAALDPYRVAVCLGVGVPSTDYDWFSRVFVNEQFDDPSLQRHNRHYPGILTSIVGRLARAQGGNTTIHTACASSGQGLGEAFEMIRDGLADVVVTGGADSMINPLHMAGFNLLGALATNYDDPKTASRPFDAKRNGFVMGEGAAILIFEEREHALARGVKILGEVCGYGVTESAYRITDLHPEGHGPIEAMTIAVQQAGIDPGAIGYVNAHGTSTVLNDMVEALAVSKVFPDAKTRLRVSSTKSVTGHLISAAGALEFALCLKAIQEQTLPPTVNLEQQDLSCRCVTLTAPVPESCRLDYALSNSVGFGGSNTALIVGRHIT